MNPNHCKILCHNCKGIGHRSANCEFSPMHRRCFVCGKAGGLFQHRIGCRDAWYNLAKRVPRDPFGNYFPREQAIALLEAEYKAEKAAYEQNQQQLAALHAAQESARRTAALQRHAQELRQAAAQPPQVPVGRQTVTNQSVAAQQQKRARPSPPEKRATSPPVSEIRRQFEQQKARGGMVQDVRITDGLMTPEGKPVPQPTSQPAPQPVSQPTSQPQNLLVADTEKTFWQHGKSGFGVRLNEVDAHPSIDSPEVLLRFVFAKRPLVVIDKDTPNEVGLQGTVLRMVNGMRVKYNGRFLDFCGLPSRNVYLAVETPSGSFRLAIKPTCVELNETTFLTDFGLAILPKHEGMISAPPQSTVTVIGEPEGVWRIRYKENRFEMFFHDGGFSIQPYEKRDA